MVAFWEWAAWLWSWISPVLSVLAAAGITAGLATAAAYAAFKTFATKWLDNKFSERLEKLRHKINSNFDRLKRVNDREFETLPVIWAKLVEAEKHALVFVSVWQQPPNVGTLGDDALKEFLDTTRMANWQKKEVMESGNRQATYDKIQQRYRHADVMDRLREVDLAFNKYRIFIWPALKPKISEMIGIIHAAVIQHNTFDEHSDIRPRKRDMADKLETEGAKLMKEIEQMVTDRLWDATVQPV